MKINIAAVFCVVCFTHTAPAHSKQPQKSYTEQIKDLVSVIQNKPVNELLNDATIITAGLAAGFQTYGYLASYAMFTNPYINGAIHYSSFQAAYIAYITTVIALRYAQKLRPSDKESEDGDDKKDQEKSLVYDEERYPFNLF